MPTLLWYRRPVRRFCNRPYRWSTMRDGCRFEPGHKGPCKPGRNRR